MPSCQSSISSGVGILPLVNNTDVSVSFNQSVNALLSIDINSDQSVYFTTNIVVTGTTIYNFSFTIYDSLGNIVATIKITQQLTTFSIELRAGAYVICCRGLIGNYAGTVKGVYVGYSRNVTLAPTVFSGAELNTTLTVPRPEVECHQPLLYAFVDGFLPPGLQLLSNGQIFGKLPYIDCIELDNNGLPAASNMYFDVNEGDSYSTIQAWEKHYYFRAKVMLAADPSKFDIERFCISIIHDWDVDKNRYVQKIKTIEKVYDFFIDKQIINPDLCQILCNSVLAEQTTYDVTLKKVENVTVTEKSDRVNLNDDKTFISKYVDNVVLKNITDTSKANQVLEEMIYNAIDSNKSINEIISYTDEDNIQLVVDSSEYSSDELLFIPSKMVLSELFDWYLKYQNDLSYPINMSEQDKTDWYNKYDEPIDNLVWIIEEYRNSPLLKEYLNSSSNVEVKIFTNAEKRDFLLLTKKEVFVNNPDYVYDTIHDEEFLKIPVTPRNYYGFEMILQVDFR